MAAALPPPITELLQQVSQVAFVIRVVPSLGEDGEKPLRNAS